MDTNGSRMEETNGSRILERELSYRLQGALIQVSQKYGYLYKEGIYQKACQEQFDIDNIPYVSEPKIDIFSLTTPNKKLGVYIPDFIIANRIIVELKVMSYLSKQIVAQLDQYLKASIYEIGYLVNFGSPRVKMVRRIYTNDRKPHIRERFVKYS